MSEERAAPDLSGILEKVMSNPAALNMLAGLIGNTKPTSEAQPPPSPPPTEKEEAAPVLALPQPKNSYGEKDRRICFLEAMRPFLSPHRQETVDRMVKISEMVTMFYSIMRR